MITTTIPPMKLPAGNKRVVFFTFSSPCPATFVALFVNSLSPLVIVSGARGLVEGHLSVWLSVNLGIAGAAATEVGRVGVMATDVVSCGGDSFG